MMKAISTSALFLTAFFSLTGCSGEAQDAASDPIPLESAEGSEDSPSSAVDQLSQGLTKADGLELPPLAASLELENGNVISFYEFPTGILISESGEAYTDPVLKIAPEWKDADSVTAIWKSLSKAPVPSRLEEARIRLQSAKPSDNSEPKIEQPFAGGEEAPQTLAPVGCNNGCCDYSWLVTLDYCQGVLNYDWFLYNYGYTWVNYGSVDQYRGLACSAEGTSTFRVSLGDYGGIWSVGQATYRTYYWLAAYTLFCFGWCSENLHSNVNYSYNQHLHTYCGTLSDY